MSVDLTVISAPVVPDLYFWALQVNFGDHRSRAAGGAHIGLQWHSAHPGSTAANWGGYDHKGSILPGSDSALPSATGNPHTRDFRWQEQRQYRLSVALVAPEGQPPGLPRDWQAWRGSITEVDSGSVTVIRDLYVPASVITAASVWSEVFAPCDAASTTVLWERPTADATGGEAIAPSTAQANYQAVGEGGCTNTNSWETDDGICQGTATGRTTAQGSRLRF